MWSSRYLAALGLLLLLAFLSHHSVTGHDWPEPEVDDDGVYYENLFTHNIDVIRKRLLDFSRTTALPAFDKTVRALNISAVCRKALRTMLEHPEREWAALMLDANGRMLRPGFLSGSITDYGDFDQCMSIHGQSDVSLSSQPGAITARYCLLSARPPIPPPAVDLNFSRTSYADSWVAKRLGKPKFRFYYRITSGMCFPTMCEAYELERLVKNALEDFNLDVKVEACQVAGEEKSLDGAQIMSIVILAFCFMAMIIGTLLDIRDQRREKKKARLEQQRSSDFGRPALLLPRPNRNLEKQSRQGANQFWQSFSLIRNSRQLFTIKEPATGDLSPIHGLRVLLICWVIICHTTNFAPLGLVDQPMLAARFATVINIARDLVTQFVISGSLSVQSFFIISGVISLHTALSDKVFFREKVSYFKYVALRWLRFAPPLLGMFCYMFLYPLIISGPLAHWEYMGLHSHACYDQWWHNFLFYNNWDILVDMCGSHTWFLSADFQINLLAYFLVAIYVRNYRLGLRINQIALSVSMVLPTLVNWYYRVTLVHILEPDMDKLNHNFAMVEFNTYNHFPAYLAGILVAAYIHQRPKPPAPASASTTRFLWWLAFGLILVVPFSTYPFISMESIPDSFLPLIYTGVKRTLWIGAFSWVIYASCTISRQSLPGQILSAKMWQPLSRLTFSIYLTQSLMVWVYSYNLRELVSVSHLDSLHRIGGMTLYSVVSAFWLHVLFEAPSVNLVKLALKRRSKATVKKEVEEADKNNNLKQQAMKKDEAFHKMLNDEHEEELASEEAKGQKS